MQNENGNQDLLAALTELSLEAARTFACCPEGEGCIPKYEGSDEYLRLALANLLQNEGVPGEWKEAIQQNTNLNDL